MCTYRLYSIYRYAAVMYANFTSYTTSVYGGSHTGRRGFRKGAQALGVKTWAHKMEEVMLQKGLNGLIVGASAYTMLHDDQG